MTSEEIYAALSEIFADIFMREDIALTPGLSAGDVEGWDSFRHIEILMAAEERFAITFRSRDIDSMRCVGDLVAVICRQRSEAD